MQPSVIHLVGPGAAGKTTTGARLARRLGLTFVDLDEQFAARHGDISEYLNVHGYASYASQNVRCYLEFNRLGAGPQVLALSSGFMTYATDVHPDYGSLRRAVATSATTLVLLPSMDYETCIAETVRRQLGRPFCRSAAREEEVIRQRFHVYRNLPAAKLETMRPMSEVIDAAVAHVLPNTYQPSARQVGRSSPSGRGIKKTRDRHR
jgi:shikimate kinase